MNLKQFLRLPLRIVWVPVAMSGLLLLPPMTGQAATVNLTSPPNTTSCLITFNGGPGQLSASTVGCDVTVNGALVEAGQNSNNTNPTATVTLVETSASGTGLSATSTVNLSWSCSGFPSSSSCSGVTFDPPVPSAGITAVVNADQSSLTVTLVDATLAGNSPKVTLTLKGPVGTTLILKKGLTQLQQAIALLSYPYNITLAGAAPQVPADCPEGVVVYNIGDTPKPFNLRANSNGIMAFKFNAKRGWTGSTWQAIWSENNRDPGYPQPNIVTARVSKTCGDWGAASTPASTTNPVGRCTTSWNAIGSMQVSYDIAANKLISCMLQETESYYLNMKFMKPDNTPGCNAPSGVCGLNFEM